MAKKGKKHQSASQKQQFLSYQAENRQEKNKVRAIERHVKNNPEDVTAVANLKRIKASGQTWKRRSNKFSTFEAKRTRVEAVVVRRLKTGAVILDKEGKVLQKPSPKEPRTKNPSLLEQLLKARGVKGARIS